MKSTDIADSVCMFLYICIYIYIHLFLYVNVLYLTFFKFSLFTPKSA